MRYQKRACPRRLSSPPRGLSEDWPSGTLPARQPEGEIRAQATLVDALLHAPADVGSIPTVSITAGKWLAKAFSGRMGVSSAARPDSCLSSKATAAGRGGSVEARASY